VKARSLATLLSLLLTGVILTTPTTATAQTLITGPTGYLIPNYFGTTPNWAFSPQPTLDPATGVVTGGIRKFVDTLPGLGAANANNLGQYIPVAIPDTTTYPGSDYYEIELGEYSEKMHSDLPLTRLRGYRQTNTTDPTVSTFRYLGPLIIATKDRPVRVKFTNSLPTGAGGNLFVPVDKTVMGAGPGDQAPWAGDPGDVVCYQTPDLCFTENRATLHLHGGRTPWISDGTPHQWITPAGETTPYPQGVSVQNVPDMPDPGAGAQTFYWTNQQSARMLFFHDHAWGITRLNVYVGEAAGYLITDATEQALINGGTVNGRTFTAGTIPADQIPLILQDKTFVDATTVLTTDPTWVWGTGAVDPGTGYPAPNAGDLWWPHVYMPAQNPFNPDLSGINPMGRWAYGPWFWPPVPICGSSPTAQPPMCIEYGTVPNPYYAIDPALSPSPEMPGTPNPSWGAEAFLDTAMVNGTAYPTLTVDPKPYRFRILNAAHDRFFNLQLYQADPVSPVYRLYNTHNGEHFYTIWPGEKNAVLASIPGFVDEGIAWYAYDTSRPNTTPIYRFLKVIDGTHFFTASAGERDLLGVNPAFRYEGIAWYAYEPNQAAGTSPVYRFLNLIDNTHFFTIWPGERDAVNLNPAFRYEGIAFAATSTLVPRDTEVKMVNARPRPLCYGTTFMTDCVCNPPTSAPAGCFPPTWPTDGRENGVPDPGLAGPSFIHIGTEAGFLPAPVVLPMQPINWNGDVTMFNAGNVLQQNLGGGTLMVGAGERADVIVDFSQYAGKTLILYNDAPAPWPAPFPYYDYYTGAPDLTATGGSPGTLPGYGPNTRTVMQIKVNAGTGTPFNLARLNAAFAWNGSQPGVFARSQDPIIVGQTAYNATFNTTFPAVWPNWGLSRISDNTMSFRTVNTGGVPGAIISNQAMQPKAIQDEQSEAFDAYGRLSAKLGLSVPFSNAANANFNLQNYVDPPTEIVNHGEIQVWKITHNGVDTHPVHFHLFDVQLINRVGWDGFIRLPDPNELGWKDTVRINPLEDTIVALKPIAPTVPFALPDSIRPLNPAMPLGLSEGFSNVDPLTGNRFQPAIVNEIRNFGWEYVWHCHILSHEEMDMMRPMVLNPVP
jgi:FtsP/CotA-like multicopper oxidase with cupredoxin domain